MISMQRKKVSQQAKRSFNDNNWKNSKKCFRNLILVTPRFLALDSNYKWFSLDYNKQNVEFS